MYSKFIHQRRGKKGICFILAMLFLVSTVMSGTYAWHAFANAVNNMSGTKGNYQVVLNKYEKDINGNETTNPIKGADFYLFHVLDAATSPETVEQIGGRYTTDEEGSVHVMGLATGNYYFLEANPSYSYSYDTVGTTDKVKYDFSVNTNTASNNIVKVTAYNKRQSSSLDISKNVVNCSGADLTDEQKSMDFTFTIKFSDGGRYSYSVDSGEPQQLGEDGVIKLKHGQTAHFAAVPVGVHYDITETPADGYVISSSNNSGNIQPDATANVVTFTNTYKPSRTGDLVISKLVSGDGALEENRSFAFTVSIGNDPNKKYSYRVYDMRIQDNAPVLREGTIKSGEKIELSANEKAVVSDLSIGTPYTVSEDDYSMFGYSSLISDKSGYILAGNNETAAVNNKNETGTLVVTKSVRNGDGSALTDEQRNKSFVFSVKIGNQSVQQFSLKDGETKTYTNIPVGTYYTVTEDSYFSQGYTTDSLGSTGSIVKAGNTAAFTNTFKTGVIPGNLTVTKTVINPDGSALTDAQKEQSFSFHVQIGNEGTDFTLKSGESRTFENIAAGTFYSITEGDYYKGFGYITNADHATGTIDGNRTADFDNTAGTDKGSLVLTKTVSGNGSKEQVFTFAVQFSDNGTYQYRKGTDTNLQSLDQDGKLTLKDGEKAVFDGIPAGVSYTVTEDGASEYFQGITEQSGSIIKGQTAAVSFENYRPERQTKLIIRKITTGEGADLTKAFRFTVTINGSEEAFTLANGEQKEFSMAQGSTYKVNEDDYISEGYSQTETVQGYGTADGETVEITKTNTYIGEAKTSLHVVKKWDVPAGTKLPDSITVYVKDGDNIAASAKVKAGDNWEHTFENLRKFDSTGKQIEYTVTEADMDGYLQSVVQNDPYDFTITNTAVKPVTLTVPEIQKNIDITGNGPAEDSIFTFVMEGVGNAPMPDGAKNGALTMYITGAGSTKPGSITYGTAGTYFYHIYEQAGNESGYTYDTSVYVYKVDVAAENGVLKANASLTKIGGSGGTYENAAFTNKYNNTSPKTINITARKVWAGDEDPNRPSSVSVRLLKDGEPYGENVELNSRNEWKFAWSGLPYDSSWQVEEISGLGEGYTSGVTSNRDSAGNIDFTVTNTYIKPSDTTTSLTVNKVWKGDENYSARPSSVKVQLYRNGNAYGEPVTLDDSNSWTYTWNGLEKQDSVTWSADEISVPTGYIEKAESNGNTGITITNTYGSTNPVVPGGGDLTGTSSNTGGSAAGSGPKTDDMSMMWLWFVLMIVSAVGLRADLFWKEPKTRN